MTVVCDTPNEWVAMANPELCRTLSCTVTAVVSADCGRANVGPDLGGDS